MTGGSPSEAEPDALKRGSPSQAWLGSATVVWAAASIICMVIAAFAPWASGYLDPGYPGELRQGSESGIEYGGGVLILVAATVATAGLLAFVRVPDKTGFVLTLGAALFATTVAFISKADIHVSCFDPFVLVTPECEAGGETLRSPAWGVDLAIGSSISLAIASLACGLSRRFTA